MVPMYIVQPGGFVRLPMVDQLKVEGLTLSQADSVLQKAYSAYYHDAFVVTKVQNHRVIVLGALGNKIVPLANQEVNLLEVLALAGPPLGNFTGKAENIRIIRGDLQKPNVIVVNLSTIEGLTRHNLRIFPNDVVYVEPIRQDYREAIRDIAPIATIFGNLAAILAILFRAGVL